MTSPKKCYYVIQTTSVKPEKPLQYFRTGTRYKLDILHQCGKRVKTKSQKVFVDNSYVCKSYRKRTRRGGLLPPNLNRVKMTLVNCEVNFEYRSEDLK